MKYFAIVFILFLATSCKGDDNLMSLPESTDPTQEISTATPNEFIDYSYHGVGPRIVDKIPEGYMSTKDIMDKYGDLIFIEFFDSQASIHDLDHRNLKQRSMSDSIFLVQFENDLYIRETEITALLPSAEKVLEERKKVYYIGDSIAVHISGSSTTLTVDDVSYAESFEGVDLRSNEWVCIVKFSVDDGSGKTVGKHDAAWKYFERAEDADGQVYTDVVEQEYIDVYGVVGPQEYIDAAVALNEMVLILPKEVKIKYLYLQSPSGFISLRKVDVSE